MMLETINLGHMGTFQGMLASMMQAHWLIIQMQRGMPGQQWPLRLKNCRMWLKSSWLAKACLNVLALLPKLSKKVFAHFCQLCYLPKSLEVFHQKKAFPSKLLYQKEVEQMKATPHMKSGPVWPLSLIYVE